MQHCQRPLYSTSARTHPKDGWIAVRPPRASARPTSDLEAAGLHRSPSTPAEALGEIIKKSTSYVPMER